MVFLTSEMRPDHRKLLFIINPVSGGREKSQLSGLIRNFLQDKPFEPAFIFTRADDTAPGIQEKISIESPAAVIAVGGDGTVNLVASAVIGTDCPLGIIPYGSGNGLARALAIPLNVISALQKIIAFNVTRIDSALVNGRRFFNVAGMGFDAHISEVFSRTVKRGWRGYVKTTISEIASYPSGTYRLDLDGQQIERQAFMVTVANSSQYGNDMHISPEASLKDGLLDVCIVSRFPAYKLPAVAVRLRNKTAHKSKYNEIIRARSIRIMRETNAPVHLDGEPLFLTPELTIDIDPLSLSVII